MTGREWVLADAFDRAAPTYDAMVALSPGYHDQLRTAAEALVARMPSGAGSARVLDLGCGSGASTQALLDAWAAAGRSPAGLSATGVDASEGMVAQARAKAWRPGVELVVADAVAYLREQPDASVDGVLGAYLLRNVPDRGALVAEVARVLRPGGAFVIHDYSVAGSAVAQAIWAAVCHGIIIPLAVVKRSDVPLHRYLYTSVRDFDSVARICRRLQEVGLVDVRHRTYPGWQSGVVHTVVGSSPS
ncbi:class I SAM-dependent methyltransferase [Phycicoccus duodecadis]|uniref:Ubiquinone/menaquinone biosynthesis C-methylase UbiE n=1 Tax=Phycicoccus duodecadis TaxID=173053 RepID=A0A2N3YLT4_9MICO|nr:class I SAM-dependent methyltransferase [Phycicoccus duodecadis]PKW27813.1 ubiquinone/menaquinone biosynthesis C-methylase UbiE [Phycicoccus duodecadis]